MTAHLFALEDIEPRGPTEGEAFVAPTAVLIGDVQIDVDASVWFGAVLRADDDTIYLGVGSNIQDNSVLHVDPGFPIHIGANCTIGHRAMIHGCCIGDNTLIGMGATILNGAKIGKNCLIGAGALVTEGKEIPDNTLVVGSPARAVRSIDAAGVAELTKSAELYQLRWRRFAKGLERAAFPVGITTSKNI
ncbi:gamma carbonic anhydrase family protein [Roseovarius sp. SK2]|uniref:gamma carbonic anhydrase family protein n=1 Tax=unclassified Roseovarius TaxID=2614913 RepID=UPI00237A9B0C|nr:MULTISPECIES: gamma carbonic anhydrase family protein [unclassified Roseovarius]MDD9728080.1 gamma carbonic anhydrase family protein [Roseovarius sp. SK2]